MAASRLPTVLRYLLILLHSVLICVIFAVGFIWEDIRCLICQGIGLAFLIFYIPAAAIFGLKAFKNSRKKFDMVGGEIGYLSLQVALWIAACVVSLLLNGPNQCANQIAQEAKHTDDIKVNPDGLAAEFCAVSNTLIALSCLHLALLAGWLAWAIYLIHHVRGSTAKEACRFSMAKLLRGEHDAMATVDMAEAGNVRVDQAQIGEVTPFASPVTSGEGINLGTVGRSVHTYQPLEPELEGVPPPAYEAARAKTFKEEATEAKALYRPGGPSSPATNVMGWGMSGSDGDQAWRHGAIPGLGSGSGAGSGNTTGISPGAPFKGRGLTPIEIP